MSPAALGEPGVASNGIATTEGATEATSAVPAGPAGLIDGKKLSAVIREEVRVAVAELVQSHGVTPGLAVVIVGARKDSATYVRMKKKAASEAGLYSVTVELDESATQEQIASTVDELNSRSDVHAILVQLPLPAHVDEHAVLKRIGVAKDVDGFLAENIGNLCLRGGDPPLAVPCTPAGCVELLQRSGVDCAGKHAVVVGRSNIVGLPMANLLLSMDATVTVVHSKTKDLQEHVLRADVRWLLFFSCAGNPNGISILQTESD